MGGWGFSCSQKKTAPTQPEPKASVPEEEKIQKIVVPIDSGPSKKPAPNTFEDFTEKWGLKDLEATHLYAVDWNNDGFVDLVTLPEFYGPPQFLKGSKKGFKKVKSSPLPYGLRASFLNFSDFNKDGIKDLLVVTLNQKTELNKQPIKLFLGKKSKGNFSYTEVPNAFPSTPYPTASVSIVDVNMDGWLDVYLGNWFDTTKSRPTLVPDRIYLGKEGGRSWIDGSYLLIGELDYDSSDRLFRNATPTFGTSICDIDQNGYPDILAASSSGYKNKVWLNLKDRENKDRKLVDYSKKMEMAEDKDGSFSKTGGGHSFYMLCTDYNNDGFFDVAMGELFHSYDPETRDRSSILTGKGREFPPQFIRTEYHKDDGTGSWSQGDRRALWADLNFDGNIDLIVENSGFPPKSRLVYFEQDSDHGYADKALDYGLDIVNPSGSVVLDVDKDGKLDLIVGQVKLRNSSIQPRLYAYKNVMPREGKRTLKIELKGKKGNSEGLGATVHLRTNKAEYLRTVDYSYGPLNSQIQSGIWFGLQKGEVPREIEVRWPIEYTNRLKRKYPLRRIYKLGKLDFKYHLSLVLNEDGSFKGVKP